MAESALGKALLRGIDQDQAMAYAFTKTIGDLTGFDALSAWGEEGALRNLREAAENPAELQSWDDVDSLADFGTYVIEALGENASGIITGAATGFGVGGIAGGVAKAGAKRKMQAAFGKKLQQSLPTEAFENFAKQRAQRIGFAAGAGASATVVNTGETQLQFDERGIDNPWGALAAGVLKGALDVVGLERIVRASRAIGTSPDTLIDLTVNVLKEAGITGTTEGVTEGFQTVIDLAAVKANDPEFDFFSVENLKEVREAVLKGGIAGAGIGGGIAGTVQAIDYNRARNNTIGEVAGEADAQQREPELERVSEPYAGAKDRPELTQEQIDEYAREDAEIAARLLAEQDAEKAAAEASDLPIPEAQAVIDAQAEAVRDPTSDKSSVLVTPGSPDPTDTTGLEQSQEFTDTDGNQQRVFSNDPVAIAALGRERDLDEETAGRILFDREGGKTDANGNVIVSRNSDGVPVSEIATSDASRDADIATAEGIAPEGGSVEEVPAPAVIGERIARLAAEFRGDTEPVGAAEVTSLLEQLTPEQMGAVQEQMRGSRLEAQRLADAVVQQATEVQESSGLGTAVQENYIYAAEEPVLRVGEEPAQSVISFPDEYNRGGKYYASRAAAERAAERGKLGSPDPNRIGDPRVVEIEPGTYGVQVELLPQELAPEQSGFTSVPAVVPVPRKNGKGKSDPKARPRRDTAPLSESAVVTAGIRKAALTGKDRAASLRGRKGREAEKQNPGFLLRAGNSVVRVKDQKGKTSYFTTKDLVEAGRDLNKIRGASRQMTPDEEALVGLTTMLGEMGARGFNVRPAVRAIEKNPDLLVEHGVLKNPADNQRDVTAKRALESRSRNQTRDEDARDFDVSDEFDTEARAAGERGRQEAVKEETTEIERLEEQLVELRAAYSRAKAAGRSTRNIEQRANRIQSRIAEHQAQLERVAGKEADLVDERVLDDKKRGKLEQPAEEQLDVVEGLARHDDAPRVGRGASKKPQDNARARAKQARKASGHGRSVTQADVDFARSILDEIGLADVPVAIVDVPALRTIAGAEAAGPRAQEALARFQNEPKLMATTYRDRGKIVIMVRGYTKNTPQAKALRTLIIGHEVGHHVFDAAVKNMTPAIRSRLEKMFEAEKAKTPTQSWQGEHGFTEWFSDKVAARARTLSSKPENIADRHFRAAAEQLKKIWDAIKGKIPKRFHANRSFNAVVAQMKEADIFDTSEILQDTTTGFEDIHFDPATVGDKVNRATLWKARKNLRGFINGTINVPGIGFSFFTTDGRLRALTGDSFADDHYTRSSTRSKKKSWHQGRVEAVDMWSAQVNTALNKYADDPAAIELAFDELSKEVPTSDLTSPLARELRGILERYYTDYLQPNMPLLERVDNYFPRAYNKVKISTDRAGFEAILAKHAVDNPDKVWESLTREPQSYTEETIKNSIEGWQRERVFTDPKLVSDLVDAGFLNRDPHAGLMAYIYSTANRAEYERVWGGKREDGSWDPQHKLKVRLNHLPKKERKEALALHMATVHPQHADPSNKFHALAGEIKAYESIRLLVFSGLASVPETAGVFARTKGGLEIKQFAADVRDTIKNPQDAKEFAEALGVVRNMLGASMATEIYMDPTLAGDAPYSGFRKLMPYMFKYNGNDKITNFSRTLGAAVGKTFVTQQAENVENGVNVQRSRRFLKELGVDDHKAILRWAEAGSPAWSYLLEGQEAADADIGSRAVIRYIEESVIHPNSSERPSWANHPVGGMFYHLKAFAVSFNKNIIGGMLREMENRLDEGGVKDLAVYTPFLLSMASMFLALGAASDELRERIKSLGSRGTLAKNNYDPQRTAMKWIDRAGFTSLPYADAVFDPTADNIAYAAGPTTHHLFKLMGLLDDKDLKNEELKAALDSIPIMSQIPSFRREIYELLE